MFRPTETEASSSRVVAKLSIGAGSLLLLVERTFINKQTVNALAAEDRK